MPKSINLANTFIKNLSYLIEITELHLDKVKCLSILERPDVNKKKFTSHSMSWTNWAENHPQLLASALIIELFLQVKLNNSLKNKILNEK